MVRMVQKLNILHWEVSLKIPRSIPFSSGQLFLLKLKGITLIVKTEVTIPFSSGHPVIPLPEEKFLHAGLDAQHGYPPFAGNIKQMNCSFKTHIHLFLLFLYSFFYACF